MKKNLLNRLLAFNISILSFCIANAQIVYTDVDPDETYTSGTLYIDLNNDGINDFKITNTTAGGGRCGSNKFVKITPLNSNSVSKSAGYPAKHNSDFIINETCVWNGAPNQVLRSNHWYTGIFGECYNSYSGHWGFGDGYIGLKLNVGDTIYYAWARLNVSLGITSSTVTIKDYAYNSIPNQPILTGETSCTSPTVSISADGPTSFCDGDSVILTAVGSGYLYQWKKNGIDIAGAQGSTYIAKTTGNYKCKVTNSCGSIISANTKVKIVCRQGIANSISENNINISPNPFSNSTTISFGLEESQNVAIKIYDLNGRLIKTLADRIFNESENAITWNADDESGNNVSGGIYLLNIKSAEFNQSQKLIISK
ncbi:MAG: T9SS type A sorting domain-containing protein [Fimbriimonadaceae bacterium]|nr:T9SS type A sorting domain-containing protein [Chitinophagales bacterium]